MVKCLCAKVYGVLGFGVWHLAHENVELLSSRRDRVVHRALSGRSGTGFMV